LDGSVPLSSIATQARLWYLQRISATVLALCVLVHLATVVYAVRGGLSAAEILARTQGNWAFASFYLVFVGAVTVHAPIGLARIVEEWLGWREWASTLTAWLFAAMLLMLGLRAVWSVFAGSPA
jgi:fumarate reductase subunit C